MVLYGAVSHPSGAGDKDDSAYQEPALLSICYTISVQLPY